MKMRICPMVLVSTIILLAIASPPRAEVKTVTVTCTQELQPDMSVKCVTHRNPDPVHLKRKVDQVSWVIDGGCNTPPCKDTCRVTCETLGIDVSASVDQSTLPQGPFNVPKGNYPYEVTCSPTEMGYIVVEEEEAIPTLSEWGLIIFSLLLLGTIVWYLRKRRLAPAALGIFLMLFALSFYFSSTL